MERPKVSALLRAYNNPLVVDLIRNIADENIVDDFVVVINADKDTIGTKDLLSQSVYASRVKALPINNYGWSRALNAGLAAMPEMVNGNELVLCISNEVSLARREFEDNQRVLFSHDEALMSYVLFKGRDEPSYCLPRNTCGLWKRARLLELGDFLEELDQKQGMEDVEMVLRGYQQGKWLPYLGATDLSITVKQDVETKTKKEWETIMGINQLYTPETLKAVYSHIQAENKAKGRETRFGY
ncbi:MAG: hypothetical protein AABX24_01665 [Nanoarchaeota archaeon]